MVQEAPQRRNGHDRPRPRRRGRRRCVRATRNGPDGLCTCLCCCSACRTRRDGSSSRVDCGRRRCLYSSPQPRKADAAPVRDGLPAHIWPQVTVSIQPWHGGTLDIWRRLRSQVPVWHTFCSLSVGRHVHQRGQLQRSVPGPSVFCADAEHHRRRHVYGRTKPSGPRAVHVWAIADAARQPCRQFPDIAHGSDPLKQPTRPGKHTAQPAGTDEEPRQPRQQSDVPLPRRCLILSWLRRR